MASDITVAIVTKSCAVIPRSISISSPFNEPVIAFAAPSAICVSYCNEPITDSRIAGKATPREPTSVTIPRAIPIAGSIENEIEEVITFLILSISIPSFLARISDDTR